ncbi:KPCD kinase, partial [Formicarius rufipectus]|nr:KPCD kinase [Formicarius rufipectus]
REQGRELKDWLPNLLYISNLCNFFQNKLSQNCLPPLTQKSASDYNNFDREFLSEKPKLSYSDKTLIESMDQSAFDGFSFINPKFEQILNK